MRSTYICSDQNIYSLKIDFFSFLFLFTVRSSIIYIIYLCPSCTTLSNSMNHTNRIFEKNARNISQGKLTKDGGTPYNWLLVHMDITVKKLTTS
jgi:hypothetical protein